MKRSISLVLCLVMIISIFSCIGITASAAGDAQKLFTVKSSGFKNGKITYTVYLKKGVSMSGSIVYAKFDSDVLAVDEANTGAYMTKDSYGDECFSINGEYEKGFMVGYDNQYSIGHVYGPDTDYKAGSSDKAYMQFAFKAIDGSNPKTNVEFYCYEFNSQSAPENNILNGSANLFYVVAPSGITVANDDGKVVVSWSKVPSATAYRVYRRTVDAEGNVGSWEYFSKVTTTTYSDKTVKSGTKYEYAVRAYANNDSSELSSEKEILYLAIPEVSVEATVNGVEIAWNKVSGAESYKIYRKVSGGSWKTIKTVSSSTSYTDTDAPSGKKVYYTVKAVKGSAVSDYEAQSLTYLKTPTVSVKNTSSGVYTSWKKISGASSYEVYRKAGSAKSWTKIATTKSTSYTDKKVKSGTTYKYTIRAVNSSTKSKYGGTAYETIRFLSAPKLENIKSTKSGVTIYWDDVKGASKYLVYRKTGTGDYELIKTVSGGSTVKYLDKTAKKGKTYTYKVYAGYSSYKSSYKSTLTIKDKY